MDNEYYNSFLESSQIAIKSGKSFFPHPPRNNSSLPEDDAVLRHFGASLCRSIDNMDEELSRFEKNFSSSNNSIFWASDYNDVFVFIRKIIKSQRARKVRLPNINSSTIFREIGIKYFLKDEKIELSDEAEIQFFAVDMMFSDSGSLLLLSQSNNTLAKLSNSATNIFFATVDRICNNSSYAELLQHLYSYSKGSDKQDMILFNTSPNCNNYLFIIDNQRTSILKDPFLRRSLTCLHCGRCNEVCPVLQIIGEEPYNNVFAGPVANITLPYLETFETYKHVTYVCTFCGRCESVCPLHLPLRDMNIHVRNTFLKDNILEKDDRRLVAVIRKFAFSRKKLNGSRFLKRHLLLKYSSPSVRKNRIMPSFAPESFNKSYKKNQPND